MARHALKMSGIARSGFEYQDLVGIEVLLEFYRDPNLFHWVELESDDKRTGKLDDVVAARRDNSFELLQVKYTHDPSKYWLNWDWLLTRRGRGSSLLQKWSGALSAVRSLGNIHSAKLRTNRKPDEEFAELLIGSRVDFDRIPATRLKVIAKELGGDAAARFFFSQFEFSHSELLIDDLEAKLKATIIPTDTDNTGWLLLREQARKWAVKKQYPEPDGKVRHEHLVQLITKRRPKPIPQNFDIPALYKVPTTTFHSDFLARITSGPRPISILWGTPGRGKSTYLSYLIDLLRKQGIPTIRHHYFLSLDDSSTDRISFTEICSSLMDQMAGHYPDAIRGQEDSPNQLRKWLESCANHFAKDGKRFFVVIDGLDHVWREQRNISQMEHLFNYVLPCPPNVCLLVGTQRVTADQLPFRLIQNVEEQDWIEVPPMDQSAVHAWLDGQKNAGRLILRDVPHYGGVSEFAEVAHAFFEISQGNPLHLIYSFEALVRRGVVMTADEVMLLPSCPEGDIRKYYVGLWTRLPTSAKKVLHLIAGSDFFWPTDGLRECAGAPDEVDHLLEYRRTGVFPFHGSILAYARDQSDHLSTFNALLPAVVRWLERSAPEYWRWAWLWIIRARLGDSTDLLSNTSRQWVVNSLADGWPAEQIINILSHAEKQAFEHNDYNKTIELRSFKIRLLNGKDLQVQRFNDFTESAIRSSKNKQQLQNMADAIPYSTELELVTILRCLGDHEIDGIGHDCYEQLRHQVTLWINLRHRPDREFLPLVERYFEALVGFGNPNLETVLGFLECFHTSDNVYGTFLRHVIRLRNFDMANQMLGLLQDEKYSIWRNATQDAMVRIASVEGIDLSVRIAPQSSVSPLLSCAYRLRGVTPPALCNLGDLAPTAVRADYDYGLNIDVVRFFHSFFFSSLEVALIAVGECDPALVGVNRANLGWMTDGIRCLWEAALEIAKQPSNITYGSIFCCLADLKPVDKQHRPSEPSMAQYRAFRDAVSQIAMDLHALKCVFLGPSLISKDQFEIARASTHWIVDSWISKELQERTLVFDSQGVRELIDELDEIETNHVTQFSERAERWIDLAQLSIFYDHNGAKRFVFRAANCIIGYGWRKDVWIFDVLSAIECIHESRATNVSSWIETLAPVIDQITVFTDGDETDHARPEFIDLVAQVKPDWLPKMYAYYISKEEWELAETTLAAILRQVDFTHPAGIALTKTLIEQADLNELEKLCKQRTVGVSKLLTAQRLFIGAEKTQRDGKARPTKALRANGDDVGRRGRPPDVTKYGPDKLIALLKRVSSPRLGYLYRREALIAWLNYWDKKGRGLETIKEVEKYLSTHDNLYEISELLDEVFNISLKYEGKARAYIWLVRAHIERHGWDYYWDDSGRVQRRLELVAKYYKSKWAAFIRDTSRPRRYWKIRRDELTIGTRWLVKLLVLVGQKKRAVDYANTMVRLTKEEVSDQPLGPVEWTR